MKLQALLLLGFLNACACAIAQDTNSNSNAYHAVYNPQSAYYRGPGQQPATQEPSQPTGYWEKTWGAIATLTQVVP